MRAAVGHRERRGLTLLSYFLENIPLHELRSLSIIGDAARYSIIPQAWNGAVLEYMVDLSDEAGVSVKFACGLPAESHREGYEDDVQKWLRMLPKVQKVQWYLSLETYLTALERAGSGVLPLTCV